MILIIVLLYAMGAYLMIVTINLAEKVSPPIQFQSSGKVICIVFWPLTAIYILVGSLA